MRAWFSRSSIPESRGTCTPAVAFAGVTTANVVDDDIAHGARRQGEKMMAIQHVLRRALRKPCIDFVDDHGRCKRLPRTEPVELAARQRTEVVVHERK